MKPSRFTEEQIIGILREQEAGAATADICRKHGISSATFCKWKAKCGVGQPGGAAPVLEAVAEALEAERLAPLRHQIGQVFGAEGVEALGELGCTEMSRSIGLRCSFLAGR
jgi:transposase-like protein